MYIVQFATILYEHNTTPRIPGKPGNEPKIDYFLMNARRARYRSTAIIVIIGVKKEYLDSVPVQLM